MPMPKEPVQDPWGNTFRSETAMCKHYGISRCTYRSRLDIGWDPKKALLDKAGSSFDTLENPIIYDGKAFNSINAFSKEYGISGQTISNGLKKGFTPEDIIRFAKNGQKIIKMISDPGGIYFPSEKAMCDSHGISFARYKKKLEKGYSQKDALNPDIWILTAKPKNITDHKGNTYPTLKDKCRTYGISIDEYKRRKSLDMSEKECLETPKTPRRNQKNKTEWHRTDHNGIVYKDVDTLCATYQISKEVYLDRLNRNWSKERALTQENRFQKSNEKYPKEKLILNGVQYKNISALGKAMNMLGSNIAKGWELGLTNEQMVQMNKDGQFCPSKGIVTDPDGNIFSSEKAMCRFYQVDQRAYQKYLKQTGSMKKALQEAAKNKKPEVYDHKNIRYNSKKEMCRAYHITLGTLNRRLQQGMSLQESLEGDTGPTFRGERLSLNQALKKYNISSAQYYKTRHKIKEDESWQETLEKCILEKQNQTEMIVYDHKGNPFPNTRAMCRFYGIKNNTYEYRRSQGMSKEEALTTPLQRQPVTDHLGNEYKTVAEMCKKYNITSNIYHHRKKLGWNLEQILTTPMPSETKYCYNGKSYHDYKSLARDNDIPYEPIMRYMRSGYSLEEAIKKALAPASYVVDHLGNKYKTIAEMCRKYGIPASLYQNRKLLGWDLEKALTTPASYEPKYHYKGKTYSSYQQLARENNISYDRLRWYLNHGDNLEEAVAKALIPCKEKNQVQIGDTRLMNNGLFCTLKELAPGQDVHTKRKKYIMVFEDGMAVTKSAGEFWKKSIRHPTFNYVGKGKLCNVQTRCVTRSATSNTKYYECECLICKTKGIWTVREILEHAGTHKEEPTISM